MSNVQVSATLADVVATSPMQTMRMVNQRRSSAREYWRDNNVIGKYISIFRDT
jgi:hypothetical protein